MGEGRGIYSVAMFQDKLTNFLLKFVNFLFISKYINCLSRSGFRCGYFYFKEEVQ